MHYSSGNYEAFVHPRKPARSDSVSAYIVGSGLAGLSAAVFLIRDGQVAGSASIYWRNCRWQEVHLMAFSDLI